MNLKKILSLAGLSLVFLVLILVALSVISNMTKSLNSDYKLVATWKGTTPTSEQFTYPTGMKIYNEQIYIVDTNEHMIKVFDLDGVFIRQFGKKGLDKGEFNRPWNIFFSQDELYVAGYENHRIDIFDPDGTYKRSFGSFGNGDGELNGPTAIAQDANDNFIVAELFGHRVSRFKSDGTFLSTWGQSGDGSRAIDSFKYPFDIATSPDKELIYILDTANERVKVYDANGKYKFRWGGPFAYNTLIVWYKWFPFDGWFADPKAITADTIGNIYVGDSGNKRVQVFDANGNHITSFGGTGEDEFSYIAGMDFSSDGSLYIVDESRKVVQKWQYQPNL